MNVISDKQKLENLVNEVNSSLEMFSKVDPRDTAYVCIGYNILRWASQGLLMSVKNETDRFIDWYPNNPGFVILRLAREGKLACSLSITD